MRLRGQQRYATRGKQEYAVVLGQEEYAEGGKQEEDGTTSQFLHPALSLPIPSIHLSNRANESAALSRGAPP